MKRIRITLTLAAAMVLSLGGSTPLFATQLTAPSFSRGEAMCRGERATKVVQAGEEWIGTHERDVIVVLGNGAEVWTNMGDDLVCVHGTDRPVGDYGHGSDIFAGPGNNTILTYGGSNYIKAVDGNDHVYLNGHQEEVEAGGGADRIWALGATSAYIHAEDGNDYVAGSPGGDFIDTGAGNDFILGNNGNDTVQGADGADTLYGGFGQDVLNGGNHSDFCQDTGATTTFTSCETISQPPNPPLPEAG